MITRSLIVLIIFLIYSCDCYVSLEGKVLSTATGKPIEGAEVEMIDQNVIVKTDLLGIFSIGKHSGFCFDPILRISSENYKPFQIKIETSSDVIKYSITYDSESIEYDTPVYPDTTDRNTFIVASWTDKYSRDFQVKNDSLIIYLDDDNIDKEKVEK